MDIIDEVTLHADDDLLDQLGRFEKLGVRLQEIPSPKTGVRTLILVDRNDHMLMTCLVRMDIIEQVKEMLDVYEHAVLDPSATRH